MVHFAQKMSVIMSVVYRNAYAFHKSRFYRLLSKLNFKIQFFTTLIERIIVEFSTKIRYQIKDLVTKQCKNTLFRLTIIVIK